MVVQQHMMAGQMVFGEIDAPLEHVSVHGAGSTFVLAGDNLHLVAAAESVVETHALEGIGLVGLAQEMLVSFMDKRADVS
jgi:hypothetical protein